MANGFNDQDTEQEELQPLPIDQESEEEDTIDPGVIHLLANDYIDLPHEEALDKLKNDYANINWADKNRAARDFAEAADSLHKYNDVTPDSGINESFSETLNYVLRENHTDEEKLKKIDEDYATAINTLYESTDDPDLLSSALQRERELDAIRLYLRRGIISKNTGRMKDMIARAADAAISPLAGTADAAFDTDFRKSIRDYTMETTRPDLDDSVFSMGASYAGTIGGFAASTFVPYGPALYLGASLTNQSKEVYDTVFEETEDHEQAMQAMQESMPWNVLGVLGDRFVGGIAGKLLHGKGGALGVMSGIAKGAVAEGGTEVLQEYGVGRTLTKYTDNPLYTPSEKELLKIFAVAGTVGGAIGGLGGARARQLENAKKIAKAMETNEPVEVEGQLIKKPREWYNNIQQKLGRYLTLKKKADNTGKTVDEVIAEEGLSKGADVMSDIQEELKATLVDKMSPEDAVKAGILDKSAVEGAEDIEMSAEDQGGFGFAWPDKRSSISFILGTEILEELGTKMSVGYIDAGVLGAAGAGIDVNTGMISGEPTLRIIREFFKDPASMVKVFWHEFMHRVSQTAAIEDGLITEPVNDAILERYRQTAAIKKWTRIYRDFKQAGLSIDPVKFQQEIDALDQSYVPYTKKPGTKHTKYRESGEEQSANAASAIIVDPERVRDNFPTVWEAWKEAVKAHPKLTELFHLADRAKTDPTVLGEVYTRLKTKGQDFETEIVKQAAEKRVKEKKAEQGILTKKSLRDFKRTLFSKFSFANKIGDVLKEAGVDPEEIHRMLTMMKAVETTYANMYANVDEPLIKMKNKLLANAVTADTSPEGVIRNFANLMDVQHIRSDTNATIDDILVNPDDYKRAVDVIGQALQKPEWYNDISNLEGEELVVGLAKIFGNLSAKSKYNTRKDMVKAQEDFAAKLLEPNTFEIRRLQANYGTDYYSVEPLWNSMKTKLEQEGTWEYYEAALKEIHDIGKDAVAALDHAGLLTPDLKDKLMRNVDTYATQNVLKYFEKDPRIPASIRKTIGSWERTGNSITSYSGKMKALMMRAAYQETQNNVFRLAEMFDPTIIKEIDVKKHYGTKKGIPTVFHDSIFDTKTVMEKKNPDKSYFIVANNGDLKLMEIDDPEWGKMFKPSVLDKIPVVQKVTGFSTALNKFMLAHWGKTLGSASFVFRSPFRDIQREALVAGSKELNLHHLVLWARHMDPEMHSVRKDLAKGSWAYLLRGETSPHLDKMHRYHALTESQAREYGGVTEHDSFEQGIYNLLPGGKDIPEGDMLISDKWNKAAIRFLRKIPVMKWIELKAQADELTTKQMGFWIAEHKLNKGPWEAGKIARDWFGTPDPTGGGSEMGAVNQLFMFSRAHANGMRVIGEIFKENPKQFAFQYAYRKLVPRMLMTSAFMGPIIGAMFGEKEEEKYRKYLDKIASYNKISKSIIPVGFIDEKGRMRYFDVDPGEITDKWKAAAIAIPMERDLISVDQINDPFFNFIENLLETGTIDGKKIASDVAASMGQVFGGHMSTGLQTIWHLGLGEVVGHETMLTGGNPRDYFRKRGVLPKDVAEAGSLYQRFSEYAMWSMYSNYPAMFGRPTKKYSTEPTSPFQMVQMVPQLGAALKAFTLVTNYGDIEKSKEAQAYRTKLDADIRLNMGENSKKIYNEASGYSGLMQAYGRQGKKWREEVSPEVRAKIERFNKWKARYYIPALQEMREARLAGDVQKENEVRERLEAASTRLLEYYTGR